MIDKKGETKKSKLDSTKITCPAGTLIGSRIESKNALVIPSVELEDANPPKIEKKRINKVCSNVNWWP